ncbi:MAG TPA: hypothetical protein PKA63_04155 [Oligoflexia bacterium]|nr:hypothetical protein [Oligoflexia bacterium]HMP47842.1 hypothetical protein [Oligoflexia bacterium]
MSHYRIFSVLSAKVVLLLGCLMFPAVSANGADVNQEYIVQNPRFILYFGKDTSEVSNKILSQGQLAKFAFGVLEDSFAEYSSLFGKTPVRKVTIRFLAPAEFRRYTGAPSWTSAMYFNDEISIPLNNSKGVNLTDLARAIRHEYAHAVIAEISGGNCPAWLDEGIAQLLEDRVNPLLGPALRKWIAKNDAMPLDWLQNGFTLLDEKIVPAAYAQSLFATRKLVSEHGYTGIANYLSNLNDQTNSEKAFKKAFSSSTSSFTRDLTKEIKLWARNGNYNP